MIMYFGQHFTPIVSQLLAAENLARALGGVAVSTAIKISFQRASTQI